MVPRKCDILGGPLQGWAMAASETVQSLAVLLSPTFLSRTL